MWTPRELIEAKPGAETLQIVVREIINMLRCRWSAVDLARESSVGVNTIRRAEVAENGTSLTAANELAIRRALELAGVEFIDENGGGPGLRLRKRPRAKPAKP
jgi:hypothetical protein